jgi:magnesium-transporting ATPase (P-type)
MLTGDGVDAAISVAGTAGLLSGDSIAVLDFDEGDSKTLVWKTMRKKATKGSSRNSRFEREAIMTVNEKSVETMLAKSTKGRCTLVVTGKAAEILLSGVTNNDSEVYSRLEDNLFRFAIFARASPKQKRAVVSSLKDRSGMKVLMCGMLMPRREMILCLHFLLTHV